MCERRDQRLLFLSERRATVTFSHTALRMPAPLKLEHSDLKRLLAALVLSGLLHGLLVLLTGLGGAEESGPGNDAAQHPAGHMTAQLLPQGRQASQPEAVAALGPAPPPAAVQGTTAPGKVPAAPLGLTRAAHPLETVNLDIPEARLPTVHGSLVLKLWIDEQGHVVAFEPEPTDLPGEYVTAVGETLAAVPFAPAMQHGKPVASVLRIEINAETTDAPR